MTDNGAAAGKVREVAPGIVQIFLPLPSRPTIVNVWLLDCGGGEWALVDTGVALAESREALRGALRELGVEIGHVSTLLSTHHHPDHFGASAWLQSDIGLRVWLHELESERVRYALDAGAEDMILHSRRHGIPIPAGPVNAPKPMDVWSGTFQPAVEVDGSLQDGQRIEIGKRKLQVVWTPGHTPGHCCFLDEQTGCLLVGDHLLPKITPHIGVYATGPRNPLGDFIASMERICELEVRQVCPAHGGVYRDHRHRARQLVNHHEARGLEMWDVIRARPASAYEVAREAFRWVFEEGANRFHAGAAVMETLAHLEWLRSRGLAEVQEVDGVIRFSGVGSRRQF